MVVDLAVEVDEVAARRGGHRLRAGVRQVDDREAAESEGDTGIGVNERAVAVRSAMTHRVRHPQRDLAHHAGIPAAELNEPSDPAHRIQA